MGAMIILGDKSLSCFFKMTPSIVVFLAYLKTVFDKQGYSLESQNTQIRLFL